MSKKLLTSIFLTVWMLTVKCNLNDRAKIRTSDGDLILEPATGKSIYLRTNGPKSSVFIGDTNLINLTSIQRGPFQPIIDVENNQYNQNDVLRRLEVLENNKAQPQDEILRNLSALSSRANRLSTRLSRLQRQIDSWTLSQCQLHTCQNGGTCLNLLGDFHCLCPPNWEGRNCELDFNECTHYAGTDLGCQNGAECINERGSYQCRCKTGWFGTHCTKRKLDCSGGNSEMCGHGTCVPVVSEDGIKCICDQGWTTNGSVACLTDVNECDTSLGSRCSTNPKVECINLPGSFKCGQCPRGYEGDGYACYDIDECATSNGGCSSMVSCHNTIGSRICGACPHGYVGDGVTCTFRGSCNIGHGGCHPSARCIDTGIGGGVQCECPEGMDGDGVGLHGCYVSENSTMSCQRDPCGPHGRCFTVRGGYTCHCSKGYTGVHCDVQAESCAINPCKNGGVCRPDDTMALGFRCECTAQYTGALCQERSHCGSILKAEEGSLVYPLNNKTILRNSKCAWIIRTVPEKVINVTFTRFNLERSPDCNFDFLQIHDGRSTADPLLGRFCGTEAPQGGNIVSSQHNLYLWFLSNSASATDGFALHWHSVAPICGGEVNATVHGSITSPGSPGKYPPNRDCYWHLKAPLSKRIQLHFFQLDLESHDNCDFDYLAIYDGGSQESGQLLEKYCSSIQPPPLLSTSPEMLIHFHSDAHSSGKGFQITYAPVEGLPGCGGFFSGDKGEITSPSYDGTYLSNLLCEYKIRTGPGTQIQIDFKLFKLERSRNCRHDYLKIYDGPSPESPIIGTFCGDLDRKITLNSTSNNVFMVFKTDRSRGNDGFKINYKVICQYFIKGDSGVVKSPGYPFTYPDNRMCEYVLETSPGKAIQLTFQEFDIEGDAKCNFDRVEVRDGFSANADLLGNYCGNRIPPTQTSSNNMMYVKFNSDMSQSGGGFYANYTTVDIECGGIYREPIGTIRHPLGDGKYKYDQQCKWMIIAPAGKDILLTWERFSLENVDSCRGDYLELITVDDNVNNSLGKFCGFKAPPTLTVTSSSLLLVFASDSSVQFDGFSVTYKFVDRGTCGSTFIQNHGVIYSPGWPQKYGRNLDCSWIIKVTAGQQIKLNISQFDIEGVNYITSHCDDFLQLRNGPAETSPLIGDYCGQFNWKSIKTVANSVFIRFKSDFMISGKGFKIEWDSIVSGCGGTFTGSSGFISSPNYPENYNENTECFFRIVTNQGSRISMNFVTLELEYLCDDYVEIYDGRDPESTKLGRFCKKSQMTVVETTSNYAFIKFKSDFLLTGKGFLLKYDAICNNNITGTYGVIESLNYPSNYPLQNCTWTINLPKGNKINMSFTDFNIRYGRRWYYNSQSNYTDHGRVAFLLPPVTNNICVDYLLIDEPNVTGHSARQCSWPKPISSKGNILQIKFNVNKGFRALTTSGFRMEWVSYGCRGHIKKRSGVLNKTMSSSDQMECEWLIETPSRTSILLYFKKVYMLESNDCTTDAIEVYNGPSDSFPILAKFCQGTPYIQSTSNYVLVKLIKKSSLKDSHFTLTFNAIYAKCGGILRTRTGVITSKNYPKNYDNNLSCDWSIYAPNGHRIKIEFTDVDLNNIRNSCDDNIKLYDGTNLQTSNYSRRICKASDTKYYVSKTNVLTLQFVSNEANTAKGFKANFSVTCGGLLTTTETSENGMISNYNYKSYTNSSCVWTILAPKLEQKVSLTITYLSLPITFDHISNQTCPNSYLRVLDGNDEDAPLIDEYCGRKVPATIVSRGSALTVVLGTHEDRIRGSFSAHYSTVDTSCGGTYISESGVIASPNYPAPYPNNADCEWLLKTSPGNKVAINIVKLDIAYSDECNEDYLEIRENNGSGRLVGLYCGSTLPINTTVASELYIKFRSDIKNSGPGFIIHYEFLHGNYITDLKNGEIASPLYPLPYDGSGVYWWRIASYQTTNIVIDELTIHSHSETCDDNLSIYDGVDDDAPLLKQLCGALHDKREVVRSSSGTTYIKLTLNEKNEGALFHLRWSQDDTDIDTVSDKPNCGNSSTITVKPGNVEHFTTPNYPKHYDTEQNCEWVFKATYGRHLSLQFVLFDVEERDPCTYGDYVSIFTSDNSADWRPLKEKACLKSEMADTFNASSYIKITFTSDFSYTKKGFLAMVTSQCGGTLTDASGEITAEANDFNHVDRSKANRCDWKVKVKPGRRIAVRFEYFNITNEDNKCETYVALHNGESLESPKLSDGKYCGYAHEHRSDMITTGNNLVVSYIPSKTKFFQNFKLIYEEVRSSCGLTSKLDADKSWEVISTPNYPNVPDPYTECNWRFTGPVGEILRVDFIERFDLHKDDDCTAEYVEIRDGISDISPSKGQFCGSNPGTTKTTGNAVSIKYVTELSEPNNGFKANISIDVCGGVINSFDGEVTSPGYPNTIHLSPGTVCEWHITGREGHSLEITPHTMRLAESESECGTRVTIEEMVPNSNTNEILKQYCAFYSSEQTVVTSSSNKVIVKLYIGTPSTYPLVVKSTGFRLTFKSSQISCNGELTTSEGYLTTPNYPRGSSVNFCSWSITVPDATRRITLEILNSGKYNIFVSDGNYEQTIAFKYAFDITKDNTTFKSTGNKMTVNVRNMNDGLFRFRARFSSNEPALCGGPLSDVSGHLKSLDQDDPYYCSWTFKPDADQLDDMNLGIDQPNTLLLTGFVNSSAPRSRRRCLYFDPKLTIKSSPFNKVNSYHRTQSITICNTNINYRILNYNVKFSASKLSGKYLDFDLQWDLQPCGGTINIGETPTSVINIPKSYNRTVECAWQLNINDAAELLRTEIKLEGSFKLSCADEFIKINRLDSLGMYLIAEYCIDKPPNQPLNVLYNNALVEYHMKTPNLTNIKMYARTVGQECGGLYKFPGKISSPNFPKGYPNNLECEWELVANELGFRVSLQFITRFAIEKTPNCTKDAVIVYDWIDDEYVEVSRLCGRDIPPAINSTYDRLKVILRTDDKTNLEGFQITWKTICGGSYNATTKEQYLYSPGYPYYRSSQNCSYKIVAQPGQKVYVKFLDFALEGELGSCENDFLTASYDYNYEIYCGSEIPKINDMSDHVELEFHSDSSIQKRGFKLSYSIYSCGGKIKEPSVITSGPFDMYNSNLNCTWVIEAPKNKTVSLRFAYFHIERSYACDADYLAVYEGPNVDADKRLALLCDVIKSATTIKSKGNTMTVEFHSDVYIVRKGFKADVIFSYAESVGCGGDINIETSYTLTSPHINSQVAYENFLDCDWRIKAPLDRIIKVSFSSFHIAPCRDINQTALGYGKCDCDVVQIKDGIDQDSLLINEYCGHTLPPDLVSSSNTLGIRLITDGEITSSGFVATLTVQETVCGVSLFNVTNVVQRVKSPGYDTGSIPRSLHCSYKFTVVSDKLIHVHFNNFDLQPGSTTGVCDKDKIILSSMLNESKSLGKDYVRWNNDATYTLFKNYGYFGDDIIPEQYVICGSKKSIDLYMKSSFVINVITTAEQVTQPFRGMDLEVSEVGFCGRNYTDLYGKILSNYDRHHNNNTKDCYTLISVPVNYTISLYFSTVDSTYMTGVSLVVYDGKTTSSNKILTLNEDQVDVGNPVFSTGNNLLLHNHFTEGGSYITYDINYIATDKGRGCGGYFFGIEGTVASPLYPNTYRQAKSCKWELETPHGTKVKVIFYSFDLGSDCDNNYVQLVDRAGRVLSTYCRETPADYTSLDNYVKIVYVTNRNNKGTGWIVKFINMLG